jgi:hypothetical protein
MHVKKIAIQKTIVLLWNEVKENSGQLKPESMKFKKTKTHQPKIHHPQKTNTMLL